MSECEAMDLETKDTWSPPAAPLRAADAASRQSGRSLSKGARCCGTRFFDLILNLHYLCSRFTRPVPQPREPEPPVRPFS